MRIFLENILALSKRLLLRGCLALIIVIVTVAFLQPLQRVVIRPTFTMADVEYKLEPVGATAIAADDIDKTFRSNSIGPFLGLSEHS